MKLGIHLSTFTPSWEDDVFPFVPVAAKIGYQMVEFPLMFPDTFDVNCAKQLLRKYNMSCTCGTGMNPMEDVSSLDASIRKAGISRLKKCVTIAESLESDCLGGVLYAPWGQRASRMAMKNRYIASIESLQEVADFAQNRGVTLSLELLNRYESFFMNTMDEGLSFLEKMDRQNVKLHYDTFHAHIEEKNQVAAIEKGAEKIWHVHLCDNNRGAPGSGAIDFESIITALQTIGYTRNLVVENFVIPDSPAGEETCIWAKRWETPEQDAEQAFRYINTILESRGIDYAR